MPADESVIGGVELDPELVALARLRVEAFRREAETHRALARACDASADQISRVWELDKQPQSD